jgi:AGCS family alanine or glycine:cation symporter
MLEKIVSAVNDIVWSPALVVLLIAAGLYFSIRTRFVQVRRLKLMVKLLFSRKKKEPSEAGSSDATGEPKSDTKGVSSFQAFCLAIAGRVGTGNIVGVATAIAMGGPGAIFWMWVIAFLGASTAFVESTLAQIYKFPHHTGWRGGPTCYIDNGLKQRWLGILFAVFTIIGYGLLLVTVQSNGAASAAFNAFNVPPVTGGIVLAALLLLVISGGIKRSANVAEIVTPIMAALYILFSLVIIGINYKAVPGVFNMIFSSAFGTHSVFGGIVGSAIAFGVKRGLFSNEAGEGGGAIISASADVTHPAKQGLVQAFSVYIDTLLVCTATALMILTSGTYNVFAPSGEMIVSSAPELSNNYVGFTQTAVDNVFGGFGAAFVSIALFFFVFTTLMAYDLYAESSIVYLFSYGKKRHHRAERAVIWAYRFLIAGAVVFGSMREANVIWQMGDIGVGLTTWINVIVILILSPQAFRALKDLEKKEKAGELD